MVRAVGASQIDHVRCLPVSVLVIPRYLILFRILVVVVPDDLTWDSASATQIANRAHRAPHIVRQRMMVIGYVAFVHRIYVTYCCACTTYEQYIVKISDRNLTYAQALKVRACMNKMRCDKTRCCATRRRVRIFL